VEVSRRKNW